MNITPAELAELLVTHSAPLRWDLAQAKATVQKEREANQRLSTNLNSAEKALAEKDAELDRLRAAWHAELDRLRAAWDEAEKHVSELTTELNATRANLSKQLDAATKRAVQAEKALAAEQAAHAKTKAQNVPHAPQVGGTIDLEFGDWVQDSSGEFFPVYLNDEKLEQTDVCVVRGTGPNARIVWVAGGEQ